MIDSVTNVGYTKVCVTGPDKSEVLNALGYVPAYDPYNRGFVMSRGELQKLRNTEKQENEECQKE